MNQCRFARVVATVAILTAISVQPTLLTAQESRGTILGRVSDPSGSAIPAVMVEAVNLATGVSLKVQTNPEGNYRLPYLLAGQYRLSFSSAGFQTLVQEKVQVTIADMQQIDVALSVGSVSERITVESAPPLEVSSATLGQVVDRRRLEELPFREGNPHELAKMAPGVTTQTHLRLNKPGMTNGTSQISVDGSSATRSDFTLDGIANTAGDRVAYSPPAAAVQEFKVQTSTYDAAAGFTGGGIVNLVTRSGTNDWHGDGWFFYRNSRFDNKDFFQKVNNQPKPIYHDRRWGGAIGGPLKRDKAHFFVATELNDYLNPFSFQMTTPTAKMRTGDFSELIGVGQIYDPLSGRVDPTNPGRIIRDPIPGNIIAASRVNPTSRRLAQLFPNPNVPGVAQNFQHPNSVEDQGWKTLTSRADYNFSSNNRAFARYSEARWRAADPDFHLNGFSSGQKTNRSLRLIAVDDIHTFSPSVLLNTRFGYTNQMDIAEPFSSGVNLSEYGLGGFTNLDSTGKPAILPNIRIDNITGYRQPIGEAASDRNVDRIYTGGATLSVMKGNHSLGMGTEYRGYVKERLSDIRARSPQLNYTSAWSVGPFNTSGGVNQLHPLASFMLGHPASGSMSVVAPLNERSPRTALFIKDDWRVSRRLTVNLGLRYELEMPTVEATNSIVNGLDLTTPLPIEAAARAAYAQSPIPELAASNFAVRGGLQYAGVGGRRNGLWSTNLSNFMPRIGVAYQLNSKTVLRGGFGSFYDALGVIRTSANQTGFSQATVIQTTTDSIVPRADLLANPFPTGLLAPSGSTLGLMTNVGNALTVNYPNSVRTPRADRMSFGFQRQLPWQMTMEATYSANRGYNLPVSRNLNFLPIEYRSTSMTRDATTINYLSTNFPNPFRGLLPTNTSLGGSANMQRQQLLLPYPHLAGATWSETNGRSWYDSLQVRADRRMADGLTINLSYTYSKNLEQVTYRDPGERAPEKTYAPWDRPHALQVNGIYEIPFGRGRRFGSAWSRPVDTFLGGWQVSLMYRLETGITIPIGNVVLQPGATFADMALPRSERTWDRQFDTSVFDQRGAVQPASNLRYYSTRSGDVRQNGFSLLDMVLSKRLAITERISVTFRAESYNMLDTANLLNINTTPTAGAAFGRYTGINGYARQYQFSTKLQF